VADDDTDAKGEKYACLARGDDPDLVVGTLYVWCCDSDGGNEAYDDNEA